MKQSSLISILMALFAISANAQKEYDSFLKEGKVWKIELEIVTSTKYYYDRLITLHGDTLIDGIPFKRMYEKKWLRGEESEPTEWKRTRQFFGEKDGKLYSRYESSEAPTMVQDFSLNIGGEFVKYETGDVYVVKNIADRILYRSDDKRSRRCFFLFDKSCEEELFYSDTWIEGIGSIQYGLMDYGYGTNPRLLRCEDNGVCIYNAEEMTDKDPSTQTTFESLLEEGKSWKMEYKCAFPPDYETQYDNKEFTLQGDTIINDMHFKKAQDFWIGQKNGVVYQYTVDDDYGKQCLPIMDFSLKVGDEFEVCLKDNINILDERKLKPEKFKVIGVCDTIIASSTDKQLRRCVYVQSLQTRELDCWVEGIGSLNYGIIGRKKYQYDSFKRLLQCSQGTEKLYTSDITVDIKAPQVHKVSKTNLLFDLQGRPVKDAPKHGIYVKDGRKVIR